MKEVCGEEKTAFRFTPQTAWSRNSLQSPQGQLTIPRLYLGEEMQLSHGVFSVVFVAATPIPSSFRAQC